MTPLALSRSTLALLPDTVKGPSYDPAGLSTGIVHLGLGGFHRAHMARYMHDLLDRDPGASGWGIAGAGLLPADRAMYDALRPQDGLYTVIERNEATEQATVIGALTRLVDGGNGPDDLLGVIDGGGVRIVSITVTENGYCLNPATKRLDPAHPAIVRDLADRHRPRSSIGVLCEALRRRMVAGRRPFTVLSCDNIQHNGLVLREAVLAFAEHVDAPLATWIAREARFPSTMVDRITPVTTDADIAHLADRFGVRDRWPVVCEPFRQWVIEDDFAEGRPAWEQVGTQFVENVAPYEFMKLRLLNASHLAIAGLGRLAGYRLVDQTMRDPLFAGFMTALMDRETGTTLPPVPGIDLAAYKRTLIQRFANPAIQDTLDRINADAPLNVLIDPLRDLVERGRAAPLLTLALAGWMKRVRGTDEEGRPIAVAHPSGDLLRQKAIKGGADPRSLLSIRSLFGALGDNAGFVFELGKRLRQLHEEGVYRTLAEATRTYQASSSQGN